MLHKIDEPQYDIAFRKEIDSGNDILIIFYKGVSVDKNTSDYFEQELFDIDELEEVDSGEVEIDEEDCKDFKDGEDFYYKVTDPRTWDETTKSHKYKNWEIVCLDI